MQFGSIWHCPWELNDKKSNPDAAKSFIYAIGRPALIKCTVASKLFIKKNSCLMGQLLQKKNSFYFS